MKNFVLFLTALCLLGCSPEPNESVDAIRLHDEAFELYLEDRFEDALPIFEQAVAKGSSDAECQLGVMYELGEGVEMDLEKASGFFSAEWFNPETGEFKMSEAINGGAKLSFNSPFGTAGSLLYLKAK